MFVAECLFYEVVMEGCWEGWGGRAEKKERGGPCHHLRAPLSALSAVCERNAVPRKHWELLYHRMHDHIVCDRAQILAHRKDN